MSLGGGRSRVLCHVVSGQAWRASKLPETTPRNATPSTTRPQLGRIVDLD
jgi:hypothetical protein